MVDDKDLERALHRVMKTGKYVIGAKEVSRTVKGSKLIVISETVASERASHIADACHSHSVPLLQYAGGSIQLGRLCGAGFRISVLAVKSPGEADLTPLLEGAERAHS